MITKQILYFRRFADQIPFSKLTNVKKMEVNSSQGDAYAIGSDQLVFGWAVNNETDMSGETITLPDIGNGKYVLKLYHTWSGRFLEFEDGNTEKTTVTSKKSMSFEIPVLKVTDGQAKYIGHDIAFIIRPANQENFN